MKVADTFFPDVGVLPGVTVGPPSSKFVIVTEGAVEPTGDSSTDHEGLEGMLVKPVAKTVIPAPTDEAVGYSLAAWYVDAQFTKSGPVGAVTGCSSTSYLRASAKFFRTVSTVARLRYSAELVTDVVSTPNKATTVNEMIMSATSTSRRVSPASVENRVRLYSLCRGLNRQNREGDSIRSMTQP